MKRLVLAVLALVFAQGACAALSKVSTGASFDNGGTAWSTTNLTKDTGTAIGDLAVIGVSWYEQATVTDDAPLDTPAGFTAAGSVVISGSGGSEARYDIFTRVIDGSEGANFTVARNGGFNAMFGTAQLLTLRGSSALSVVSITNGTAATGVASINSPSVSGTSGQGLVAAFGLDDPGGTYTPPSGMTLGISDASEDSDPSRIYYVDLSSTGATGTKTLAWTPNSRGAIGISILIAGAGSAGPSGVLLLRRRRT